METCKKCGKNIDKSACGNTYSVITINRDENEKHTQERFYLCRMCTLDMELSIEGSLVVT